MVSHAIRHPLRLQQGLQKRFEGFTSIGLRSLAANAMLSAKENLILQLSQGLPEAGLSLAIKAIRSCDIRNIFHSSSSMKRSLVMELFSWNAPNSHNVVPYPPQGERTMDYVKPQEVVKGMLTTGQMKLDLPVHQLLIRRALAGTFWLWAWRIWRCCSMPPPISPSYSSRSLDGEGDRHQCAGTIHLEPLAAVSTDEYQTDVYEHELATAGSLAEDIILSNVVLKEHRLRRSKGGNIRRPLCRLPSARSRNGPINSPSCPFSKTGMIASEGDRIGKEYRRGYEKVRVRRCASHRCDNLGVCRAQ
jgi:hypothetical protein